MCANYLRRIVSGNKARFKDANLDVELDLVYVTDHLIIMGYPATGTEGIYRNRREDAKKFLEHRHGKDFWVFNFCPITENSYPSSFFDDRVSRYPFPDHHAPPFAILALAAREIHQWLSGSKERVAVLHCKAGKGRSGTLACAYLLSMDEPPSPPKLKRSMTRKEWAKTRADRIMDTVETEEMPSEDVSSEIINSTSSSPPRTQPIGELRNRNPQETNSQEEIPQISSQSSLEPVLEGSIKGTQIGPSSSSPRIVVKLEDVITLHTSRRMKRSTKAGQKLKQGVSIPSQRRWLYYWSLVLTHASPPGFWDVVPSKSNSNSALAVSDSDPKDASSSRHRVRLRQIVVRMRELTGMKKSLLKVANTFLERSGSAKTTENLGSSMVWASVARYDDEFVDTLETWERHTRAKGDGSSEAKHFNMGRRRLGSDVMNGESVRDIFSDSKWDKTKMVRSFARFGEDSSARTKEGSEESILVHTLKPLSDKKWAMIDTSAVNASLSAGENLEEGSAKKAELSVQEPRSSALSSSTAIDRVPNEGVTEEGIVLDADREVRVKLHVGRVFLGWFWFIPTFHMPHPAPTTTTEKQSPVHFKLIRKEVDFPVGLGSHLVDVDVELEWIASEETDASVSHLVTNNKSFDEVEAVEEEGNGLTNAIATMQVIAEGGDLADAVELSEANSQ